MPSITDTPRKSSRIIRTVNGVRGVAILMVFGVHLVSIGYVSVLNADQHPLIKLLWLGWTGVDLFFVLSGFLITGILVDTQTSPNYFRSFYMRRILRIFPLYYAVVLLGGIGYFFFRHTSSWHHFLDPRTLTYLLLYVQNYHGMPPAYAHFWSLALEEQFYLLWPLLVFAIRSRRAFALTIAGLLAASFVARFTAIQLHGPNVDLNAMLQYRVDGLLVGALLALAIRNSTALRQTLRIAPFAGLAGLLGFLWIAFGTPHEWFSRNTYTRLYGFPCLAVFFGASVLLAWAAENTGNLADRLLCTSFLQFTGKYSYGLYVFHAPILLVAYYGLLNPTRPHTWSTPERVLLGLAAIALSYTVAYLSFNFYESWFLTFKDRFNALTPQHPTHPDFPERDHISA